MSGTALALVLLGALCHALWNVAAKRVAGGLPFVFLCGLVSLVGAGLAALGHGVWQMQMAGGQVLPEVALASLSPAMWGAMAASAVLHVVYLLVLQQGYRASDFAVVYPVARGSGPMLTVLCAMLWLSEWPSAWGQLGVGLVLAGVAVSAGALSLFSAAAAPRRRAGVQWGLLTGLCIAGYTLVDGWAIKRLGMAPALFYGLSLGLRSALLAPLALRQRAALVSLWRAHRREVCIVGLLSPVAYLLVLLAVQRAPLSYVAPVREVSMLMATALGARLLKEPVRPTQWLGAALMVAGVLALAWA